MENKISEFNEVYYTKGQIKYRIPTSININNFWETLIKERKKTSITTHLQDQNNRTFWFNITPNIAKNISYIDEIAKKDIFNNVPNEVSASVVLDSLINEAFNSSVIEGAFSTKKRTEELVNKKLTPQDKSERMILNNYYALEYILENLDHELNEDVIINIYKILTKDTLDKDDIVNKYRTGFVGVWDQKKNCYTYKAPPHDQVQNLIDSLIEFVSSDNDFHPLIKACIIHFYFVYIHPFFDGNGRTARAISYMYLLQNGYDFFKFFSISSLIQEERRKYYESIENTEIYDSDLTYFIDYYLNMIVKSIQRVIDKFSKELGKQLIKLMLSKANIVLNKRQLKIINYFLSTEKNIITTDDYKKRCKISYETARTDLLELTTLGFFSKKKIGKKFIFTFNSVEDVTKLLSSQ